MAKPSRNEVVDSYRAILIGMVMCFHLLTRWAPPNASFNVYQYRDSYSALWNLGAYGVEVFFVISGLVITMTLLKSHDVIDFAFRRFSRLYPALWVCATITLVVTTFWGPAIFLSTLKNYALSLTMDAPDLGGISIEGAYWSLNVELKFYFWIAFSYLLLKDRFWIFMSLLTPAAYLASLFSFTLGDRIMLAPYLPFFLIGMSAWYLLFARQKTPGIWTGIIGIACLPLSSSPLFLEGGHLSVLAICLTAALTVSMLGLISLGIALPLGPLPYLGRISYSLYLLHENVGVSIIALLKSRLHLPDLASFGIASAFCICLAAAVFQFVEVPAKIWLRSRYHTLRPHLLGNNPPALPL